MLKSLRTQSGSEMGTNCTLRSGGTQPVYQIQNMRPKMAMKSVLRMRMPIVTCGRRGWRRL